MNIREVIKAVREIEKSSDVVVIRHNLITSLGNRLDISGEAVLKEFDGKLSTELKCIAVQPIKKLVEEKIRKKITIREINHVGDIPFYGYVEDYEDRAVIKVKSGIRLCWLRFTVIKELMHLYSDTCADAPNAAAALLVKAARDSRYILADDNATLDAETAAFYMALEMMIPWRLREQFRQLRDFSATRYQIAKAFMLPEPFVAHFVEGSEGNYAGLSNRLNKTI